MNGDTSREFDGPAHCCASSYGPECERRSMFRHSTLTGMAISTPVTSAMAASLFGLCQPS